MGRKYNSLTDEAHTYVRNQETIITELLHIKKSIGRIEGHLGGINGFIADQKNINIALWKEVNGLKAKVFLATGGITVLVLIFKFLVG